MEEKLPYFRQHRFPRLGAERGAALILVLWLGTFFAIVLSSFAFSMRTELVAAKNFKNREQAQVLAMAGVTRAIAELVNIKKVPEASLQSFRLYDSGKLPLGKGTYEVIVSDEESKISLNAAAPDTLRRLLRNNGLTDLSLRDTIVDSILDWRDTDDLHRVNGAEAEYYATLPLSYRPRNGPFEIVEEILLVKGMTREILYGNVADAERLASLRSENPTNRAIGPGEYLGVYPFLTVHGSGKVNLNSADLDVLVATGLTDEEARLTILRRQEGTMKGPPFVRGKLALTTSRTYRIEAIGRVGGSPVSYRIAAAVVNDGGFQKPRFKVIAWHEG